MSRICAICGKKEATGFNISHSHRKTKRKWRPNLQTVRVSVNGKPKKLLVCTKCIKAGKITKHPVMQKEILTEETQG